MRKAKIGLLIFSLLSFCFLFSVSLSAQGVWEVQRPSSAEPCLWGISFLDTLEGWVSGGAGKILHTTNGGEDWVSQTSGVSCWLGGITFVNENLGWVVGRYGIIKNTTNGGENWNSQSSGTGDWLQTVCFIDSLTGWIVGSGGTILHTTDGGDNWSAQTSGVSDTLFGIDFLDTLMGYAVGKSGIFLLTTDGGNTWLSDSTGIAEDMRDICFIEENHFWVVGDNGTILSAEGPQTSPSNEDLWGVDFVDTLEGWAIGMEGGIIHTTDGGENWESYTSPTTLELHKVFFTDREHGWAVGYHGLVLHYYIPIGVKENAKYKMQNAKLEVYPNPFSKTTVISYSPPTAISIYDISGRLIRTFNLTNQQTDQLTNQIVWDGTNSNGVQVPSGVYFCRLTDGEIDLTKKLMRCVPQRNSL